MKILYLINYAGKGGTEKYVRQLVDAYHKKRAECLFAYHEDGPLVEEMQSRSVSCFRIEMRSPFDLCAARKLAKYCRENGVDIIHTQFPRENCIAALSKLFYSKPVLFNTSHLIFRTGALWRIINRTVSRFDEKIFTVCTCGRETLIQNGIPPSKIEVIFNGVAPPEKPEAEKLQISLRASLAVAPDAFVVTSLTRYTPEKGVPFLVDTAARVKARSNRPIVFLVAGDGELYSSVSEKINALGLRDTVRQLGYRTDTAELLAISDLFFNPSQSEALSFAILEALSHGLPVVATDVGGTGDIVNDTTRCGIAVPYGDADAAASAILRLAEDEALRETCSQNAKNAANGTFSLERMLDGVYERYAAALLRQRASEKSL